MLAKSLLIINGNCYLETDWHMNNDLTKDKVLHDVMKLNEREIAVVLAVLAQHDPSIMINNDKNYLARIMSESFYKEDDFLVLLKNIPSLLVLEKELEWFKTNQRSSIWLHNYFFTSGNLLPNFRPNMNSNFIDNLITGFDCAHYQTVSSNSDSNPTGLNSFPDQQYSFQQSSVATKYSDLAIDMNNVFSKPNNIGNGFATGVTGPYDNRNNYSSAETDNKVVDSIESTPLLSNFNFALEQKSMFIFNAKILYNLIRTTHEYISWIDIKDENQLYWAWNYLNKAGYLIKPQLLLTQNNDDIGAQIYASIDSIDNQHDISYSYSPTAMKKYFISNMRKAWSQKKFRDKKDIESAQDLLLSRVSKKQLMNLSKSYGINTVEMLSIIIDEAYKKSEL